MALDFSHGVDNAFLEDNLLSAEDWGFHNDFMDSDIIGDGTRFENFGITLGSDHFGIQDDSSSNSSSKSWSGMDDDFSPTIDVLEVKDEPSSPALSLVSTDSSTSQNGISSLFSIKLESPPLTPPHEVVTPAASPPLPFDPSQPLNLVTTGRVPPAPKQNSYVISNGNAIVPNGIQIVNGNIPQGAQLLNTNLNFVPTSNGVLISGLNGAVPTRLPAGVKVNVVNGGTKRSASGAIKSGGRGSGPGRSGNSVPKREVKGVTIHPPIIPKSVTVPSTVATVTSIPAAKAIVFSNNINSCSTISPQSCQPSAVTISQPICSPQPPSTIRTEKELNAWKRQQRMIKNRESASLSRKKKKEYVQTLEQKMQGVVTENEALKEENSALKKRLCALEEEVERLKTSSPIISGLSSPGRYATCLLTVILFLGINLSPFSLLGSSTQPDQYILPTHHGRSLLAFNEELLVQNDSGSPAPQMADIIKDQYYNETLLRLHDESSQHLLRLAEVEHALLLQQAMNISYMKERSEEMSSRLMEALEKLSNNKSLFKEEAEKNNEKEHSNYPKKRGKKPRKKKMRKPQAQTASLQMESDERSLQVYDSFFIRHYENLINSLDRKHDTYYIVSFTRDHLLLPATSHNSTQRPKMSLVMPAGGNASFWNTPPDHMTMMQIDCEVTNTRTINMPDLKERALRNETEPPTPPPSDPAPPVNLSSGQRVPNGRFKTQPPPNSQRPFMPAHSKSFKKVGDRYRKDNVTDP